MHFAMPAINNLLSGSHHGSGSEASEKMRHGKGVGGNVAAYDFSYSSTEVSYSQSGGGRDFSVRVFEARMSGRLASFGVKPANDSYQSQVPTPQDVANKVLGFVEKRIENAARNGASPEDLESLFAQAAEGVDRGYAEAMEELDARGLITDELQEDIDSGYQLIQDGLAGLRERYLPSDSPTDPQPQTQEPDVVYVPPGYGEPDVIYVPDGYGEPDVIYVPDGYNGSQGSNSDSDADPSQTGGDAPSRLGGIAEALSARRSSLYAANVGINVQTQDGDNVRIRMVEASGSQTSLNYRRGENGEAMQFSSNSFRVGSFEFSVDGELDEDELNALADMLQQVEGIAASFFGGDMDAAFSAAMDMNVDGSEIANYAINMRSLQYERVDTAYRRTEGAGDAFQSLAKHRDMLADSLNKASMFADPARLVHEFLSQMLQTRQDEAPAYQTQYVDFAKELLERMSA
ncbi:DUF5610 domain-containing protein [Hahella sp. NBU794]|uniref:DUF5610 domain-containing protein n=1 Tax=Hahella sp. NBU794 TaxID=3422590 RepID=UPI003D70199D